MYEQELKKLGLTDGEARAYLALLKEGSSTVGPITKRSGVAYSKIYEVLERLMEKGLVSFTIKEKTKYFQALEPNRIEEVLDKKEDDLIKQRELLSRILPSLNKLSLNEEKQGSEIFVGEKGIMTAYDIFLDEATEGSTLRFFYMHDPSYDEKVYDFCYGRINYNNKKIAPTLKKKKMKWLGIINEGSYSKKMSKPPKPIISKYVDFPVPGNIDITDNSVLITVWTDKPLGILIQSKEVARNFQKYFDSIWKII
ncbi:hypothetical protein COU60_04810 [Candidatus Pacearchaeota archaeon CG10_big_fil_rev_8_21_14_0_10_34_76]|nr:MAG: hypothetical protein COU60_04810 [Candidatus Pacearchaeota archaeon CG10_big_fil_rev_8_21_14_0_10_34_76]